MAKRCNFPDPDNPETEDIAVARAQRFYVDESVVGSVPSGVRKAGIAEAGATTAMTSDRAPATVKASAPANEAATPAQPAAHTPAGPATTVSPESPAGISGPEAWEIPIGCFRCGHNYATAFKHFRSGAVLYCPACHGSFVVTTSLYGAVDRAVRRFFTVWRNQFPDTRSEPPAEGKRSDESRQKQLAEFLASLKETTRDIRVPGAPRKRTGMFG
ncbi:MAG: hypothetical protein U0587_16105 [Candidatus Binatia bacterium]